MPYSASLAERIGMFLDRRPGLTAKKMFGGLCYLLYGNLLVGVWKTSLIVRLGPDGYEKALLEPHVREFDVTGKPMKGWVMVEADGLESDVSLQLWIERALDFVTMLPKK